MSDGAWVKLLKSPTNEEVTKKSHFAAENYHTVKVKGKENRTVEETSMIRL